MQSTGLTAPQLAGRQVTPFALRIGTPFASIYRTTMEFYQTRTLTTPASDNVCGTEFPYRLNSLYKPDVSTSQQPLGFATLAGIYARYRVDRVRLAVRFSAATNNMWAVVAVVGPSQTYTTTGENQNDLGRNPMVATNLLDSASAGNESVRAAFEKEFSIAQLFGYTQAQYQNQLEAVTGTDVTSPSSAHIPYLLVNCSNRGHTTSSTVVIEVRLIFDCVWFERDVLIQ